MFCSSASASHFEFWTHRKASRCRLWAARGKVYGAGGSETVPRSVMLQVTFHKVGKKLSRWDISAAFFQERNNDPVCPAAQVPLEWI